MAQRLVRGEDYRQLFPLRVAERDIYLTGTFVLPGGRMLPGLTPRPIHPDGLEVSGTDRRFETTWLGGVRHGPFRAFRADGTLWSEARYERGRVVEAWLITRDGRRFNELEDGEQAAAALLEADTAASTPLR